MRRFGFLVVVLALLMGSLTMNASANQIDWTPQQILDWIVSLFPHGPQGEKPHVPAMRFVRNVYETLPDDLAVGTRVRFDATPEMMIGQTGTTTGFVRGYSFMSYPNVKPVLMTGPLNRQEWPDERYIVQFDKHAGNMWFGSEVMLYRHQFVVE